MAAVASYKSRLYVGTQRFSAFASGFNIESMSDMLDVSSLEDQAKVFIPGQFGGTGSIDMMLDTAYATQSQFTTLNTWIGTPQVETLGPSGAAITNEVWMVTANQSNVSMASAVADKVTAQTSITHDGAIDRGVIIAAETAITIDTNGTSVDNGASTANGGVAHLHVTAYSGLTSNSVIVEHSTNDSIWTTLGTFASVTGVTSERLVIAPGTTVNRYLRIRDDVTGAGSCTRAVAFARR
jgi:hypothetical protein